VFSLGERVEELGKGVVESFPSLIPGAGWPTRIKLMRKNNDLLNAVFILDVAPYCHTPF